ncbi:MAG: NUDIX hydrolase [Syntrophaceae bacterium]
MSAPAALTCPHCGRTISAYRNPAPTVDIIIAFGGGIVLIKRKNPPHGWALPGGFVDYGEAVEHAAAREAKEETNLEVKELTLLGVYSDPARDPRGHTISTVFTAQGFGELKGQDDAAEAAVFTLDNLPEPLAFDHARILADYREHACKST